MANRRISISELEFDSIKQNFKEFLRAQNKFTDFDFEGSNMSILLDILAYNTHYNAVYTNMALNEVFLDSASRRGSVVSIAKSLGYTPRSYRCASTVVDFVVTGVPLDQSGERPPFITLPKYSTFQVVNSGVRYTLYTQEDITAGRDEGDLNYYFEGVRVMEGAPVVNTYEFDGSNSLRLPNDNVDTSTITVKVQDQPGSSNFQVYLPTESLVSADGDTPVFFTNELDGLYAVEFGDGVVGKRPPIGAIVTVEYMVSSGSAPNGTRLITYSGSDPAGGVVSNLTMRTPIGGGSEPEDIEQIRFNAPNFYASQNRAVSAQDYESILLKTVPSIRDVAVWGGENNNPPVYGKVFISARTFSGGTLSLNEKDEITRTILNQYKVVSVIPEFTDPDIIEVELDLVAYYDTTVASRSPDTLRTLVTEAIIDYNENELGRFNRILRQSIVSRIVESVDDSFVSSVPRMRLYRTITPVFSRVNNYRIEVGNPFIPGTINSSGIFVPDVLTPCVITDDGLGTLRLETVETGIRRIVGNIGTVDYNTGSFRLDNLNILRLETSTFKINGLPASADIVSTLNQTVEIDLSLLKVSVIADESTKGRAYSGNKFQITNSRI